MRSGIALLTSCAMNDVDAFTKFVFLLKELKPMAQSVSARIWTLWASLSGTQPHSLLNKGTRARPAPIGYKTIFSLSLAFRLHLGCLLQEKVAYYTNNVSVSAYTISRCIDSTVHSARCHFHSSMLFPQWKASRCLQTEYAAM